MKPELHYAVLSIDAIEIAIPQSDVRVLESTSRMVPTDGSGGVAGWISTETGRWPVYCFDETWAPVHPVPAGRKICVLLNCPDGCYGILSDDVRALAGAAVVRHPLPPAMRVQDSPLQELLISGGTGIALSNGVALLRLLARGVADGAAP
jgi:hypothetical protein